MLLELTEILRCPRDHEESYLICAPVTMDGRDVVRGGLFCPVCRREYAIIDRVAWFAPPVDPAPAAGGAASELTPEAVLTFLDLQGHGGVLLTLGGAGRLASGIARLLPGVAVAAVNPPVVAADGSASVIHSPAGFPVRQRTVRAAVVGPDQDAQWLARAAASVLHGLRIIVEDESAEPPGFVELARGAGVFVGEKRSA